MKALILAAGFGTRLLPFTENLPKPLFPILNSPVLDITIKSLIDAGCTDIIINTHHLHLQIDNFTEKKSYPIPVNTVFEPEILGTGGAIKNLENFWDDRPFVVINSDIVTDISINKVYDFHLGHDHPATLVMHDYEEFNKVHVSHDGFIEGFRGNEVKKRASITDLAFTGIQVLNPTILDFIPESCFFSSIDAFEKMIASGKKIKAFIAKNNYWQDMGTPGKYTRVVFDKAAPIAFQKAFPEKTSDTPPLFHGGTIIKTKLKGDGSDRIWHRLTSNKLSIIMADHGIRMGESTQEVDSFVDIGRHLYDKGIPVPKIHYFDRYSGLVFLEDLGDENLQSFVKNAENQKDIIVAYKTVIDLLVRLSIEGAKGFDLSWTYQTQKYSRDLIIEKECLYFANAFLNKYLGIIADSKNLADEFRLLSDKALKGAVCGFMHRDMQSRNIMKKGNSFYFIDFQGGRSGPMQYDLASLLIDPYVKLPSDVQDQLVDYCFEKVAPLTKIDKKKFFQCYKYCRITRNLQMLGAFGFLSYEKKKTYFEEYIPTALNTLQKNLELPECNIFPKLREVVQGLEVT